MQTVNIIEWIAVGVFFAGFVGLLWHAVRLQWVLQQAHEDEVVSEIQMQHKDGEIARLRHDVEFWKETSKRKDAFINTMVKRLGELEDDDENEDDEENGES